MNIKYRDMGEVSEYRGYEITKVENVTAQRVEFNVKSETLFFTCFSLDEVRAEIDSIEDDTW